MYTDEKSLNVPSMEVIMAIKSNENPGEVLEL